MIRLIIDDLNLATTAIRIWQKFLCWIIQHTYFSEIDVTKCQNCIGNENYYIYLEQKNVTMYARQNKTDSFFADASRRHYAFFGSNICWIFAFFTDGTFSFPWTQQMEHILDGKCWVGVQTMTADKWLCLVLTQVRNQRLHDWNVNWFVHLPFFSPAGGPWNIYVI